MNSTGRIPKVSVCVITYNQEKFIRECLQSIVEQETDFEFEVIVGDDHSGDGTAEIIREFAGRYPRLIIPVLHESHVGGTQNLLSVHNLASGDYVAHIDGDDYALPRKLQALKDFLDHQPDCNIVWHRMIVIDEELNMAHGIPVELPTTIIGKEKLHLKELATYYGMTGCHSGSMYRRSARSVRSRNDETLDYYFTLSLCSRGGCAMYLDETLGVYRFFSNENTITRSRGGVLVGLCKISLITEFMSIHPELAPYFSAQILFEIFLRSYFRQPLVGRFAKLLFKCRAFPNLRALISIVRVFNNNRAAVLKKHMRRDDHRIKQVES